MKSWVEKTYLVRIVTEISQKSIFRSLMKRNEIIAYDNIPTLFIFAWHKHGGIRSQQQGMTLPMIRVILGFSRSRNEPSYIRSDPGSVVGIDALRSSHC